MVRARSATVWKMTTLASFAGLCRSPMPRPALTPENSDAARPSQPPSLSAVEYPVGVFMIGEAGTH